MGRRKLEQTEEAQEVRQEQRACCAARKNFPNAAANCAVGTLVRIPPEEHGLTRRPHRCCIEPRL